MSKSTAEFMESIYPYLLLVLGIASAYLIGKADFPGAGFIQFVVGALTGIVFLVALGVRKWEPYRQGYRDEFPYDRIDNTEEEK